MIAQQLAARHPKRVKSLTLVMTSSGSRRLPCPTLKVRSALTSRPADPTNPQSVIDHCVRLYRLIGSPGYPATEADLNERLGLSVQRSYRPQGIARQMVAIAADGNRSELLGRIRVPTQIIHGRDDPLIPVAAGHDLAAKIACAQIDVVDGRGHDLPVPLWPRFLAGIGGAAGRAWYAAQNGTRAARIFGTCSTCLRRSSTGQAWSASPCSGYAYKRRTSMALTAEPWPRSSAGCGRSSCGQIRR